MKPDVKKKLQEIKEFIGRLDKRVKVISGVVAVLIIAGAVTAAVILNHKDYVPLFSEVSQDEGSEFVGKLLVDGAD